MRFATFWSIFLLFHVNLAIAQVSGPSSSTVGNIAVRNNPTGSSPTNGPPVNFVPPGAGGLTQGFQSRGQRTILATDYASGSNQTATGSISASSSSLTLNVAIDFANGEGIRVLGAGPSPSMGVPTGVSVTVNRTGHTSYSYQISALDSSGGVKHATSAVTITNGNATLGFTNYNTISWTAGSGSTTAYAIYRKINSGPYVLAYITTQTNWVDGGFVPITSPNYIPTTPPSSDIPDWFVTTIVGGGGTASLTLGGRATTAVSNATVYHDDTAGLQAAINYAQASGGGNIVLPCGVYNLTGPLNITASYVGFTGNLYCTRVLSYAAAYTFYFSGGVNRDIYGNFVSGIYFVSVNQLTGGCVYARFINVFSSRDVTDDRPPSGPTFIDFNDVRLSDWRVIGYWGYGSNGLTTIADGNNVSCCMRIDNFLAQGNSTQKPNPGTGTDKIGWNIDGRVATIQGNSVSMTEIEGTALSISDNTGDGGHPEFINITDFEQEYSNSRAVDIKVGKNLHFVNMQLYGMRDLGFYIAPKVLDVGIANSFIGGGANGNIYIQGTNVSIANNYVYDASDPNEGGTPGTSNGIIIGNMASNTTVTGNATGAGSSTTGNPTWQNYGISIDASANHFAVTGNTTFGNVNVGIQNLAGSSATQIVGNNSD